MPRIKLADVSKTLTTGVVVLAFVSSIVGGIAFFDNRYASSAESRQIQRDLQKVLLSQLYAERREIERIPERQRSQRDRDRLAELNREIAAMGGK